MNARFDALTGRMNTMNTDLGKRINTLSANTETVVKELHDMRTEFGQRLDSLESRRN